MDDVIQHIVEEPAGSKAAGGLVAVDHGVDQPGQAVLLPLLVVGPGVLLGPGVKDEGVRSLEAQVKGVHVPAELIPQVDRQGGQDSDAEIDMGVAVCHTAPSCHYMVSVTVIIPHFRP